MRVFYLFFSALIASGIAHAADATPLRGIQWAHTTRAYCASVAPAPCAPSLTIVVYNQHSAMGYRVAITYKPSNPALSPATVVLYADQVQVGSVRGATPGTVLRLGGAILRYDPCLLDPGDIAIQAIEATPVHASGQTITSSGQGTYLE